MRRRANNTAAYQALRAWVLSVYRLCVYCGKTVDKRLSGRRPMGPTLAHLVPVIEGGAEMDPDNCALAHFACNLAEEHRRRAALRAEAALGTRRW